MKAKPKRIVSPHAKKRIKQRFGDCQNADELSRIALHSGIYYGQLKEESAIGFYLNERECKKDKIARLYQGYIFIYSKSKRLITMYWLPEDFKEEYESIKYIEELNRKRHKRNKERKRFERNKLMKNKPNAL